MSTITDTTTTTTMLATPLTLPNGASIKNRLVKAAMSEQLAGPANQPTAELARVYRRWAHGGAGLIITGNVMIDRRSLGEPSAVPMLNADTPEETLPFTAESGLLAREPGLLARITDVPLQGEGADPADRAPRAADSGTVPA